MIRMLFSGLLLLVVAAPAARAKDPNASAAKQTFDQLQQQWAKLVGEIRERKKAAGGSGSSASSDPEIAKLRHQADDLVNQLVQAGLDVYRADPQGYPQVNSTLLAVARFYVVGDAQGDGGDQYEKALALIRPLLEAGAGQKMKQLWLWGGVSAYAVNEFDLAEKYLDKARQAGLIGDSPPGRGPNDPRNRVWQLAKSASESLPQLRAAWEKEKQIRAAEAKADDLPRVKLTTTRGEIVIELFENEAPQAVANFLSLVKKGFYDGVVFHRVLPGFMAQGGDPTGTGSGGPGYSIRCECYQPNARQHFRGSLSMAHAGRDTGGSQFFLTFVPTSFLDGRHTVFGRVIQGMDVAASLKRRDPQSRQPAVPDKIIKAEVIRDRGHAYKFEKLPKR